MPSPNEMFYITVICFILILIMTIFNIYHQAYGHRHKAKDIDMPVDNPGYHDMEPTRPLDTVWRMLLGHINISISVNREVKKDLVVIDYNDKQEKQTSTGTNGVVNYSTSGGRIS